MNNTLQKYNNVIDICRELFVKKTQDNGTSWCIMRPLSNTNQKFIKAQRIRALESVMKSKIKYNEGKIWGSQKDWKIVIKIG